MPEPYNYLAQLPNPSASVLQGIQGGIQLAGAMSATDEAAAAAKQREFALQQAKAQQDAMKAFYAKPSSQRTADDYEALSAMLPKDVAENMRKSFEMRTGEQQRQDLLFGGQVMSALRSGDRETANNMLLQRADAARNAGDETQAKAFQNAAEMAAISPEHAETFIGTQLATLPGGKDFLENIGKQQTQRFEAELHPAKKLKEYSDAKIAEAKAKWADLREQLEIDKLRPKPAGAGGAAGVVKPALSFKDQLNFESKLRDDFTSAMKPITEMSYSFQRLNAAQNDAAGDLALIFNYMKMLDPGSAVREGEFANAQNAAGVPDMIRNQWNKLVSGERLNPAQRDSFKTQAEKIYEPYKEQGKRIRAAFSAEAKRIGSDPTSIFISSPEQQQARPQDGSLMLPVQSAPQPMMTPIGPPPPGAVRKVR